MRRIPAALPALLFLLLALAGPARLGAQQDAHPVLNGDWVVNEQLSDDTDRQVEVSIRKAGGTIPRTGREGKRRYRGGPEEHALYDHLSYDESLTFLYREPEFRLIYDQGYERVFHSDNRRRAISASGTGAQDKQDFSFASWDGARLLVESRVRDGGWILETYTLVAGENGEDLLKVVLELKPSSFAVPINITRVYNRAVSAVE
jgi:hypothetical protein